MSGPTLTGQAVVISLDAAQASNGAQANSASRVVRIIDKAFSQRQESMTILKIHHTFGVSWINNGPESIRKRYICFGCMSLLTRLQPG